MRFARFQASSPLKPEAEPETEPLLERRGLGTKNGMAKWFLDRPETVVPLAKTNTWRESNVPQPWMPSDWLIMLIASLCVLSCSM